MDKTKSETALEEQQVKASADMLRGVDAGSAVTTGYKNTAIGYKAGEHHAAWVKEWEKLGKSYPDWVEYLPDTPTEMKPLPEGPQIGGSVAHDNDLLPKMGGQIIYYIGDTAKRTAIVATIDGDWCEVGVDGLIKDRGKKYEPAAYCRMVYEKARTEWDSSKSKLASRRPSLAMLSTFSSSL